MLAKTAGAAAEAPAAEAPAPGVTPAAPSSPPALEEGAAAGARRERDERYREARGARTNFLTLAGQTLLLGFQMLGGRLFGAATWGAYAWGLSMVEVWGRLGLAGSDKGIMIFVAARRADGDEKGAERALATGLRLGGGLSLILMVVLAAIANWVAPNNGDARYGPALRTLSYGLPLVTLTTLLLAGTMALRNLRFNLLVKGVTEPVLRVALVAALGLTASGVGALTMVYVFAAAGTLAVTVWAFSRMFSLRRTLGGVLRGPLDRPMLKYAMPLAVAEVVNCALGQLNVQVLGWFRPAEDVGAYAAAATLAGAVSFLRGAFDTLLAPIAAEAWARQDRARLSSTVRLYSRTILAFALLGGGALLVGGQALLALHGPDFVRASSALAVLVVGHIINASCGIAGWVLLASGRSRLILLNNVGTCALNLVLCLVLIPRYGMLGAALAATLSLVAIHTVVAIEVQLLARAQPLSVGFLRVLGVGVALIAGEIAVHRLVGAGTGLLWAIGIVVAGAPLLLGLVFALGRADDRQMLRGLVRHRRA
jgi:O-antigen/teichoic acid export membrane protein